MIGGAPSTGSSLLRQILNRHSNIYCGPETRLLSIQDLYQNWTGHKNRIFKRGPFGVRPNAWHNITGVLCTGIELYESRDEVEKKISNSESFEAFVTDFFGGLIEKNKKNFWAEKTPNNIYTIRSFLDKFPEGKVIITIRNPLEIICSLMDKGNSLFHALSHALIHLSLAAQYEQSWRIHFLSYEHLTRKPETAIKEICTFIGQDFEAEMLMPDSAQEIQGQTKLKGWRYSEIEPVHHGEGNRFEQLSQEQQLKLLTAMQMISFHDKSLRQKDMPSSNYINLYNRLPYSSPRWISDRNDVVLHQLLKEKRQDQIFRLKKFQFRFLRNYPIQLHRTRTE